jgi:hypothetical protein
VSSGQSRDLRVKNPDLNKRLQVALRNLGPSTDKAGESGVLRVLISYPATPDSTTLTRLSTDSRHPVSTVDMPILATNTKQAEGLISLERTVSAAVTRKRKSASQAGAKRKDQGV